MMKFLTTLLLLCLLVGCAQEKMTVEDRLLRLESDRNYLKGWVEELRDIAAGNKDTIRVVVRNAIVFPPPSSHSAESPRRPFPDGLSVGPGDSITRVVVTREVGLYAKHPLRLSEWPMNYVTIKVPFIATGMIVKPSFFEDAKWWVDLMQINGFYLVGSAQTAKWLFVTPYRGAALDSAQVKLREKGLIE